MSRYIVKKAFKFTTYDSPEPVEIEEGNMVSYKVYNEPGFRCDNAIKITVYGPDSDIILDGPNKLYLGEYLREVEFNDLARSKEYMFEQQKDRTCRHGITKNYVFVDNLDRVVEDNKDEANYNKRINIAAVLDYLQNVTKSEETMDNRVIDWITSETVRLKDEMKRLDVLAASDEDIIQNALMEYGNQERYNGDVEIANKITDVRDRYLEMLCESKNKE